MKTERAGLALVEHAAVATDEINAIRPARVRLLDRIADAVDQRRKVNAQFPHAAFGHAGALGFTPRVAEQDTIPNVAGHLPKVGGMRLADVHRVKRNAVAELVIELVERGNLPAEGRSSIAPEHENNRADPAVRRQLHGGAVIDSR